MTTKSFGLFAAGAALAMLAVLPACVPHSPGVIPPPPGGEGQRVCESYGGTFAAGPDGDSWRCTNLPNLTGDAFIDRFDALEAACEADEPGNDFTQTPGGPQDAICE
jgi:hypothetical protein